MKTKIEEKEEEKEEENPLAWIVKHFHCEGLEPHNLSLDWICETIEEVGATIDIGGENSRHYSGRSFAIRLRGTSGVLYRISVHYRPRFAELLADRFEEIDLSEDDTIDMLMRPFKYVLDYEIHWLDERDGNWEHMCIHGRRDRPMTCWPGDELVTTLQTLKDDLRHAIMNTKMNTLRQQLRKTYIMSFCARTTPKDVTWDDVANYVRHVGAMEDANEKEAFVKAHETAMLELYELKKLIWSPEDLA